MKHNFIFSNKVYTECSKCGCLRISSHKVIQYWLNGTLYDYEPVCHIVSTEGESLLDDPNRI